MSVFIFRIKRHLLQISFLKSKIYHITTQRPRAGCQDHEKVSHFRNSPFQQMQKMFPPISHSNVGNLSATGISIYLHPRVLKLCCKNGPYYHAVANMAHIMGKSALSALTNCPHKLSHFQNQFHKTVAISVHIYLRSLSS